MTPTEIEQARAIKLLHASEHEEQNSEYYAYVQKVHLPSDVNKGLRKLKIKHDDPMHISCAYPLQDADGPFNQEGLDNDEHGAGRTIVNDLKSKDVINIAVYVVRYYGGIRLGPHHFKIIQNLTASAIS